MRFASGDAKLKSATGLPIAGDASRSVKGERPKNRREPIQTRHTMHTEFRRAETPKENRSLVVFDHKAFHKHPADWFNQAVWQRYESWWMIIGGRKIGCCAFGRHIDFQEDLRPEKSNPHSRSSLYIATTGILPQFRGMGFGNLMKSWQLSYAHLHGFTRIVTNTRKSNKAMIGLNEKFGFKIIRTTPGYYEGPREPTVVMERRL